jgi:4-amino-4-deoxy-L-arabinose transferase-like glycosyltransferase
MPTTATRSLRSVAWFAIGFAALVCAHATLLELPYYWDEAGYYIPAARDLYLHGSLIPISGPSNAHPPLVMAYLALAWKTFGFRIVVTRVAMIGLATFALAGLFRLAEKIANREVAAASVICTAMYPVFFAQSSLAQVDLPAAGFCFWALAAYFDDHPWATAVWFSLAALAKETAILVPLALLAWEIIKRLRGKSSESRKRFSIAQLLPFFILALWYAFHYFKTGFVFGNPEFFRYNVSGTLNPLRIVLALSLRLRQLFLYMDLGWLTALALLAMLFAPRKDDGAERNGIPAEIRRSLCAVITVYTLAMAVVGGAVLARYMLPVVPLIIVVCVTTLWRRMRIWVLLLAFVVACFSASLFINPAYGFSFEDNLAYRDYILLHQSAEQYIEGRYPQKRVLTAWPASDELALPYLGYISHPVRVLRIEDFTVEQLISAADLRPGFDVALVFSTKYESGAHWFERWPRVAKKWLEWKTRFFGYHQDLPPAVTAQLLGGRVVYSESRNGQWIAVIEMSDIREAKLRLDP